MKSYIDDMIVTDPNGEESVLYPRTKQEAVEGLQERLSNIELPDITTTRQSTLPNSHAGRVKINEIVGGIEQKTTSGKNLLEITNLAPSISRGLSVKHLADGGVRVYGTHDGTGTFIYILNDALEMKAGSYILSGCPSGGSSTTYSLRPIQTQGNMDIGEGKTHNISEDTTWQPSIILASGTYNTAVDLTFYPMIRLATETDATYEPFTNGASPNSDYPQDINGSVVSGVRVHGEQCLNVQPYDGTSSTASLTVEVDNIIVTALGDGQWRQSTRIPINIPYEVGKQFTVSVEDIIGTGSCEPRIEARYLNEEDRVVYNFTTSITKNNKSVTYTIGSVEGASKVGIILCVNGGETASKGDTATFKKIMVNEGAEAKPYKPYQGKEISLSQPITLYGDVLRENVERKYAYKRITSSDVVSFNTGGTEYGNMVRVGVGKPEGLMHSTHFIGISYADRTSKKNIHRCYIDNNGYLWLRDTADNALFTSVEDAKTFLDSNEVYILYELSEPNTEELATADKISLNSLSTYDGITYVEFIDVGVMPSVSFDYGTSKIGGMTLEGLLAGINGELQSQINNGRITALESAVVNNV